MTLAAATGKTREVTCDCGTKVTEEETKLYPGGTYWRCPNHKAPCGFQCTRGGLRSEPGFTVRGLVDTRRYHGVFGDRAGLCSCVEQKS